MKCDPETWRKTKGLSSGYMATVAGIKGRNPHATYRRYEKGVNACPASVIPKISDFTNGEIGPVEWQAVRLQYLAKRKPLATVAA